MIFCYACLVLLCVPHIGQLSPRAPIPRRLALAAAIYLFDMSHLMERPGLSLLSLRCPHALLLIISRAFLRLQPHRRRGRARC